MDRQLWWCVFCSGVTGRDLLCFYRNGPLGIGTALLSHGGVFRLTGSRKGRRSCRRICGSACLLLCFAILGRCPSFRTSSAAYSFGYGHCTMDRRFHNLRCTVCRSTLRRFLFRFFRRDLADQCLDLVSAKYFWRRLFVVSEFNRPGPRPQFDLHRLSSGLVDMSRYSSVSFGKWFSKGTRMLPYRIRPQPAATFVI